MKFDARIDGRTIAVTLTSDRPLEAPVLCLSLMAPFRAVSGGEDIARCGGYGEIQLPNLSAGKEHVVELEHLSDFRPANRAWLPLGAYLRTADGPIPLPALAAGRTPEVLPPGETPELKIVPPVTVWRPTGGEVSVTGFASASAHFDNVEALARRTGLGPFLAEDGLPLSVAVDGQLSEEAYRLEISRGGVRLSASSKAGRFYGAISLLTLKATHAGALPCGTIEDAPRFPWRGQHLDCARHFYEPHTIRRLMDLMALLKMNRFHWHFADDEAFRLEVTCFPDVWKRTCVRGEGETIPGVFGGGVRSGGSYSLETARDVVAHGQALEIGVLPEIEVPAHALALARVMPELRDPSDTGQERSVQGYAENVLNPARDQFWTVIEQLSEEVAALFPLGMLHLGCDELPEGAWEGSPAVADLKAREGLESADDVSGWTMAKLAGHLSERGVRVAAWEEAARGSNGGIGHGALLQSWSGQGPGLEAARAGYDVIMSPAQHVYLDMAHSDDPDDWGASWAAFVALEDVIAWSPVPPEARDIAERIKGVEGCFWSEFTTHDREMEAMVAPRILGVAAKGWDITDRLTGAQLRGLAHAYAPVFAAMDWQSGYR
ncbi:putative glycosyl hydrolase, beta-N-acetylhexosaminidase protein-like [Oceanicola granulosus HTCC2516]|uniref:beta-N-acetylhexosaminidase n=1 Tax=Oceanicola granulosus (strain ATCC BAA-861 / DSM 15982 / KCTC 12143 / HTCC2516) TaxID=314256 RepID=Q2CFD4_OCEGH|nr:beta-N-acetylhexosaminidase [Oceanicola granulosus]EAR51361.1 putative glycosyl hydrolase, beta-N-acetylhexosaminidase protein-like [Oceanicola granulosus HTCC2516]